MIDVITYCPDLSLLATELHEKLPDYVVSNERGGVSFCVNKTPTVKNDGGESLALIRVIDPSIISDIESLSVLSQAPASSGSADVFDALFADPAAVAIYDSVYDRSPRTLVDPESGEIEYMPPQCFGGIA